MLFVTNLYIIFRYINIYMSFIYMKSHTYCIILMIENYFLNSFCYYLQVTLGITCRCIQKYKFCLLLHYFYLYLIKFKMIESGLKLEQIQTEQLYFIDLIQLSLSLKQYIQRSKLPFRLDFLYIFMNLFPTRLK